MGFMTWQLFRCNGMGAAGPTDDCTDPNTTYCISAALIRGQAEAMSSRGFTALGYNTLSIDDCASETMLITPLFPSACLSYAVKYELPHLTLPTSQQAG